MKRFVKAIKYLKLSLAIALSSLVFMGYSVYAWATKKDEPTPQPQTSYATPLNASYTDASPMDASQSDAFYTADPATYPGRMLRTMQYEKLPKFEPLSPYYVYVDKKPLSTTYPYVDADKDYFKDALFIGDSRIEGLMEYGNISGADFCYRDGISVFNIQSEWMQWGKNGSGTLKRCLAKKQYKKIYIMLGVNELGNGYATDYAEKYNELITLIHKKQKKAVVIVMGTMYVTSEYAAESDVFNNDNIDCRNSLVAGYIDGVNTFYLDVNPAVADKDGALNPKYTNDGVHLTADNYYVWVDYLKSHALQDELWK
ncbi:GDSL-like Lipase/Acylhydrolase family protein [Lachnospiraceae bacterium NE2001]|nr:GDSL-like Lipase/Acylhydrolase family protein [Lachnospiraceae bacterium NE2001]